MNRGQQLWGIRKKKRPVVAGPLVGELVMLEDLSVGESFRRVRAARAARQKAKT